MIQIFHLFFSQTSPKNVNSLLFRQCLRKGTIWLTTYLCCQPLNLSPCKWRRFRQKLWCAALHRHKLFIFFWPLRRVSKIKRNKIHYSITDGTPRNTMFITAYKSNTPTYFMRLTKSGKTSVKSKLGLSGWQQKPNSRMFLFLSRKTNIPWRNYKKKTFAFSPFKKKRMRPRRKSSLNLLAPTQGRLHLQNLKTTFCVDLFLKFLHELPLPVEWEIKDTVSRAGLGLWWHKCIEL